MPGRSGDDHLAYADFAPDIAGVQRASAAIGDHREIARIAFRGDSLDRVRHCRDRDAEDPLCSLDHAKPQRCCDFLFDCAFRRGNIKRHLAAEKAIG